MGGRSPTAHAEGAPIGQGDSVAALVENFKAKVEPQAAPVEIQAKVKVESESQVEAQLEEEVEEEGKAVSKLVSRIKDEPLAAPVAIQASAAKASAEAKAPTKVAPVASPSSGGWSPSAHKTGLEALVGQGEEAKAGSTLPAPVFSLASFKSIVAAAQKHD